MKFIGRWIQLDQFRFLDILYFRRCQGDFKFFKYFNCTKDVLLSLPLMHRFYKIKVKISTELITLRRAWLFSELHRLMDQKMYRSIQDHLGVIDNIRYSKN